MVEDPAGYNLVRRFFPTTRSKSEVTHLANQSVGETSRDIALEDVVSPEASTARDLNSSLLESGQMRFGDRVFNFVRHEEVVIAYRTGEAYICGGTRQEVEDFIRDLRTVGIRNPGLDDMQAYH